jgi:hypothetical protein
MNPNQGVTACSYKPDNCAILLFFLFLFIHFKNTHQWQELHNVEEYLIQWFGMVQHKGCGAYNGEFHGIILAFSCRGGSRDIIAVWPSCTLTYHEALILIMETEWVFVQCGWSWQVRQNHTAEIHLHEHKPLWNTPPHSDQYLKYKNTYIFGRQIFKHCLDS